MADGRGGGGRAAVARDPERGEGVERRVLERGAIRAASSRVPLSPALLPRAPRPLRLRRADALPDSWRASEPRARQALRAPQGRDHAPAARRHENRVRWASPPPRGQRSQATPSHAGEGSSGTEPMGGDRGRQDLQPRGGDRGLDVETCSGSCRASGFVQRHFCVPRWPAAPVQSRRRPYPASGSRGLLRQPDARGTYRAPG
jgi:hypothetical protein